MGSNNSVATSTNSLHIAKLTAITNLNSSKAIRNKEDVIIIWLDKSIDVSRTTLPNITNDVLLYSELEPCSTYIRSNKTERIFFIISGDYAEQNLDQIHDLPQIDSIFIFCSNLNKYKNQFFNSEQYSKVIDIFDNEDQLIKSIREELNNLYKQLITFSLYTSQKPTRNLLKESAYFLWFQLFKDILFQMPKSEQHQHSNTEALPLIDKVQQTNAKQFLISRLCNKALRTADIELLYTLRDDIQDLCKDLAIENKRFKKQQENEPIIKVYCSLQLTKNELEKFQSNIGSLISSNGFLSTSRNYDFALELALKTSKRSVDVLPTLFIIEADLRIDHGIFTDLSSLSTDANEQEILFDIGCAFEINEVYFDDEKNVWIVNVNLTNEGRQSIETYIEANRHEMENGNIFLIFGILLIEMERYDQAKIYFEHLLSSNMVNDKISLYSNIGRIKYLKGLDDEALRDLQIVSDLQEKQTTKNDIDLLRIMNNIGLIYIEKENYDLAFDYLFKVIKIYEKNPDVDDILLANTYNAIGIIFNHKRDYNNALKYLFHAMKVYEIYLPTLNHPLMATNYNSIGLVFYYIKEYDKSLNYCSKAYEIREKILPKNHSNLGDSCNNLALIHQQLDEHKQALDLLKRSLSIYENNPDKKQNLPVCFNNLGLLYVELKDYDQAIHSYLKALGFYNDQKKFQDEIGYTLDNLGVAYEAKDDVENALKYYIQSSEYQQQNPNRFVQILIKIGNIYEKDGKYDLARDYYQKGLNKCETSPVHVLLTILTKIGMVYHRQNKYEHALIYYKYCLAVRTQISSKYNLDLAWIYNNMGCLYDNMGDLQQALKYHTKAYDIRKKSLSSIHPDLATTLTNLGRIHQQLAHRTTENSNEIIQALGNYKAAFNIRRKSLPIDHPDLAVSYYNLALIHFDQQEYEQAYVENQKALDIQRKILTINHSDLKETLKLERKIKDKLDYKKAIIKKKNYSFSAV